MPFVDKETRILNNALKAQENEKKREERKKMRASRKAMREALQMASGTKERREIKAQFDGAYKTPPPPSSAEDVAGYTSSVTSRSDDGTDSGGGVPSGYEETAFTMCVNGSPVPGTILFKAD